VRRSGSGGAGARGRCQARASGAHARERGGRQPEIFSWWRVEQESKKKWWLSDGCDFRRIKIVLR